MKTLPRQRRPCLGTMETLLCLTAAESSCKHFQFTRGCGRSMTSILCCLRSPDLLRTTFSQVMEITVEITVKLIDPPRPNHSTKLISIGKDGIGLRNWINLLLGYMTPTPMNAFRLMLLQLFLIHVLSTAFLNLSPFHPPRALPSLSLPTCSSSFL